MAYAPYTPELSCPYTLTGPDGTIAAFNNPADANFCGYLSSISGLDSADVREVGDILVAADGGWHGNFWYGRRPITMTVDVVNLTSATDRATKIDKIRRASNAMRGDAVLGWQPSATGAPAMQTWIRRQQPMRVTGGWTKQVNLALVSQYAPLFSQTQHVVTGTTSLSAENVGDYPSYPVIRITGPSTNPVVTNTTTGAVLKFVTGTLPPPSGVAVQLTSGATGNWFGTGKAYYWIITATNAAGQTTGSAEVSIIPGTSSDKAGVLLSWTAVQGATGYKIYRSLSEQPGSEYTSPALIGTTTTATTFTDPGDKTLPATAGAVPTTNTATNNFTIASGHFVDIDTLAHTAIMDGTTSENLWLDYAGSTWPVLVKGTNAFTLAGGGTFQITYRDCWT